MRAACSECIVPVMRLYFLISLLNFIQQLRMLIESAYFSCSILGKLNILNTFTKRCTLINCSTPFLQIEIKVANALLLFLINPSLLEPVCSPAQTGYEIDN